MNGKPLVTVRDELRDLAAQLNPGAGKPAFDYDGFRRVCEEFDSHRTEEELAWELAALEKMLPKRAANDTPG
jgi:hypothetical protein